MARSLATTLCVTVPFTNGVRCVCYCAVHKWNTDNYGHVQEKRCTKHTDVGHKVCLYHVAIDTFSFTSMKYIILRIARCFSWYRLKN